MFELLFIIQVKFVNDIQCPVDSFGLFFLQARAKQLYNAGYKTLTHLANADPAILTKTITNLNKKQANQMVASAKVSVLVCCPQLLIGFKMTSLRFNPIINIQSICTSDDISLCSRCS